MGKYILFAATKYNCGLIRRNSEEWRNTKYVVYSGGAIIGPAAVLFTETKSTRSHRNGCCAFIREIRAEEGTGDGRGNA